MNINIQYAHRGRALRSLSRWTKITTKEVDESILTPALADYEEYCRKYVTNFLIDNRINKNITLKVVFIKKGESHIIGARRMGVFIKTLEDVARKSGTIEVYVNPNQFQVESEPNMTLRNFLFNVQNMLLTSLIHETIHVIQMLIKTLEVVFKPDYGELKLESIIKIGVKALTEFSKILGRIQLQNKNFLKLTKNEGEAELFSRRIATYYSRKGIRTRWSLKPEEKISAERLESLVAANIKESLEWIENELLNYDTELNEIQLLLSTNFNILIKIANLLPLGQTSRDAYKLRKDLEGDMRIFLKNIEKLSEYVRAVRELYRGIEHEFGALVVYVLTKSKQHHPNQKPYTMLSKFIESKRYGESRKIKSITKDILNKITNIEGTIRELHTVLPKEEQELGRFKSELRRAIKTAKRKAR